MTHSYQVLYLKKWHSLIALILPQQVLLYLVVAACKMETTSLYFTLWRINSVLRLVPLVLQLMQDLYLMICRLDKQAKLSPRIFISLLVFRVPYNNWLG